MIGRRATHDGLMKVVAQRELVSQLLEHRCVAVLDVEEAHRVAARVIARQTDKRIQVP